MNGRQRRAIWIAIALLFVALLIPPWMFVDGPLAGYGFMFSSEVHWSKVPTSLLSEHRGDHIYIGLLLVEAFFITLATAGAVIALRQDLAAKKPS